MPIYTTVGGVQRELSAIPATVGGTQRDMSVLYATVGGVQREIFSGKTKWERYAVNANKEYYSEDQGYDTIELPALLISNSVYMHLYSTCTVDQSTGKFNLSGTATKISNGYSSKQEGYVDDVEDYIGLWCKFGTSTNSSPTAADKTGLDTVAKILDAELDDDDSILWSVRKYTIGYAETYERGSYIDTVEASSSNAYPENGAQGDYWYVKITEDMKPQQLSYIESSGAQYINLGFVPNADTEVEMDFQLTTAGTGNNALFAVNGQFSFRWYGASSVFRSNGKDNKDFPTGISGTARHTVVKNTTTCTLDGTYSVTNTAGTVTLPLYLMAQNASTSVSNYASGKVYGFKRRQAGALVNDWVPWQTAAGDIGLMDVLNGKFYGNAGTGVFTGG